MRCINDPNKEELITIETQLSDYLEEDDISRYSDNDGLVIYFQICVTLRFKCGEVLSTRNIGEWDFFGISELRSEPCAYILLDIGGWSVRLSGDVWSGMVMSS